MTIVALGGTEDHVHILFHLPPKLALAPPLRGFPDVPSAPTASALGYHVSSLTGLCFENPLLALGMQFSLQFIRIRSTPPPFSTGPRVIHIVPLLTAVYFGDNIAYDYRTRINQRPSRLSTSLPLSRPARRKSERGFTQQLQLLAAITNTHGFPRKRLPRSTRPLRA